LPLHHRTKLKTIIRASNIVAVCHCHSPV
jgi:hypothetical protein